MEDIVLDSFWKASIIPIEKPDKTDKKTNYSPNSLMNIATKSLTKY
jgi:hypothetical protein